MTTIAQGTSQVINLSADQAVQVSTTDLAYVDLVAGAPGSPYDSRRILKDVPQRFGPYGVAATIRVRAVQGVAASDAATLPSLSAAEIDAFRGVVSEDGIGSGSKSILTIGGDHPYSQWWGTNGNDGLAAMYLDAGIRPYIAICADETTEGATTSGYGATLGKPGMLTVSQAQQLQARGCEFVSHGTRHADQWELFNTGIRVWYTGGEATPTVNISTTQLTTSTATTGATNFLFSTYPTLAQLATAIQALSGWNCALASELTGSEPSSALMALNAARSVTDDGSLTKSNQRFCLAGGIMIRYTGQAYRDVSISVNDGSSFFSIFADGARIAAISTAATLSTIVTAINALGVAGLYALLTDNGLNAQTAPGSNNANGGQTVKNRESYCNGDELGTGLMRVPQAQSVNFTGLQVYGGMGFAYVIRRSILAVKERAASLYGLTINAFAQPGNRFYPWLARHALDEHVTWRGNRSFTENYSGLSPHAMPANHPGKFVGHFTSIIASSTGTPYQEADVKAIIDALGDGDGWAVTWLNHLCTATPGDPSPYTGLSVSASNYGSADQDEGPFYRELRYAASARDAGLIEIAPPTKAERLRTRKRAPSNLIFNPRFRNGRNNNLLGITSSLLGSGGIACPGWALSTASTAGNFSAVTVDATTGELTVTTNGALGSNKTLIGCNLFLEPGKTYDIGATLNLLGWGAANLVRWILYPMQGGMGQGFTIGQSNVQSPPWYGGFAGDAAWQFTVPPRATPRPARVLSIAGPFAFGGTDTITVNVDNKGASNAVALSGLTTAKAVADAINSAIAATSAYAALPQYFSVARAEDNRVIIEAPALNTAPGDSGSLLTVANGVGTPLSTLFGAGVTTVRATGKADAGADTTLVGYRLALLPSSTAATQTLKLLAPYCREVRL